MKKIMIALLALTVTFLTTTEATAQKFRGLDKSPMDVAAYPSDYKESSKLVKVQYSRPQLKERALSKLAPNDKVWRTGANEAAEITFYKPMMVGSTLVQPGTYSLFTVPGDKTWTIIINKASNVWGSYSYDKKMDVARTTGKVMKGDTNLEAFSIAFDESKDGATMYMGWGDVVVATDLKKTN
ncbi:hypothetical protein ULMS_26580 [Patiriisocius marinistellae]|uniref:Asparagine synthetase B n=1 Tax=Patiriisocius marinistellae TaxID=2494560 RepID=A0A5J4FY33_9FLAO|nr:DUF2911 domain-containing protein [Patiriisocius marinistellae]GEQ87150.1 hypothetical protein ULMS_26580 [Patiriisocius marinistellae]